jgi:hypothetical protein
VERSIVGIIDRVDALETGLTWIDQPSFPTRLMRTTTMRRRRWRMMSPSTLHVHHHNISTAMTNRCPKSFHALCVDQIGKVLEVTFIVALINNTLTVMMILLLKLCLQFLPFMACMMLKHIKIGR